MADLQTLQIPQGHTPLINPQGKLVYSPDELVQENINKYHYQPATEEQLNRQALKEQYGEGFQNELVAGVEGGLSGATLGVSRHAENILGLTTPEAQAARKEFNPTASGVGEAVGFIAPAFVAPELALPTLLERGGAKVATKILGEEAAKTFAGKLVSGAVQGAVYNTQPTIEASALGDPTLTAQKTFSQIGMGALFGSAISGVASALGLGAKRFLSKSVSPDAEAIVGKGTSTLEGEGITTAEKPLTMEGTIKFDVPDKEILKRAETLNPKNPLQQNDLNFIKKETPEVFKKIGSEEIPTYGTPKAGEVTGENAFMQDLEKFETKLATQEEQAKELISQSGLTIPIDEYKGFFEKQKQKLLGRFNTSEGRKAAVKAMDDYIDRTGEEFERLGTTEISAEDLRSNLQALWDDNKRYFKMGTNKPSAEEIAISGVTKDINKYLKGKIEGYGDVMETYSKDMNLLGRINKQFRLQDGQPTISGWFENRIATPLEKVHLGNAADQNAKNMVEFSEAVGRDWPKINNVNRVFGRLNPEAATGSQRGTWTEVARQAFDVLKNPMEIPGKLLSGTAKIALTGEMPEFVTKIKAKGIQDMLMGRTSNSGAVNSILGKFGDMTKKGSAFLEGPFSSLMVPAGVKLQQFVSDSDSVDHADQKLEVLMALEKAQKKADQQMNSHINSIFSDKQAPMSTTNDEFLSQSPKELAKSIDDLRNQTNELINDPEKMMNQLEQVGKTLHAAPDVVAALNMTSIRGLQLLSQKLNQFYPNEQAPLDPKNVPSKSQLYSLIKTIRYINNPTEILKEVASGRLSTEGVEVMNQVHPELYNEMKALVMNGISKAQSSQKSISMNKRMVMSAFLGMPLDSTIKPQSIQNNQAAFAMPQPNQPKPRQSSKPVLANQMMTPLQQVANRNN